MIFFTPRPLKVNKGYSTRSKLLQVTFLKTKNQIGALLTNVGSVDIVGLFDNTLVLVEFEGKDHSI